MWALEQRADVNVGREPHSNRAQLDFQRWDINHVGQKTTTTDSCRDTPRWHPRISPYRLLVLSTTIGLGTVKILALRAGNSNIPTTVEWIGGTVLSVLFFSVSSYDSADHHNIPPRWIQWLFLPDCMDVLWALLSVFSLPRPKYMSNEKPSHQPAHPQPPITAYRILVCAMVIIFGLGKAMLTYLNIRYPAAAWMDWTLGVPIFAILYGMGLYEYNSVDLFRPFFVVDRSDFLFSATTGMSHVVLLFLGAGWTCLYAYTSTLITYNPSLFAEIWSAWSDGDLVFLKLIGHDILYAGTLGGVLACVLIFRKIVLDVTSRQGMVRRMVSPLFSWIGKALERRRRGARYKQSFDDPMVYELRELKNTLMSSQHKDYDPKKKGAHRVVIFSPDLDLALYVLVHVTVSVMALFFFLLLALIVPHSQWALQRPSSVQDAFIWLVSLMGIAMTWFWTLCLLAYAMMMTRQVVEPFNLPTNLLRGLSWKKSTKLDDNQRGSNVGWIQKDRLIGLGPFERLL